MRNPSYLTKNRHGVWMFQSRVPGTATLIRKSTKTKDRKKASRIAFVYRYHIETQHTGNHMGDIFKDLLNPAGDTLTIGDTLTLTTDGDSNVNTAVEALNADIATQQPKRTIAITIDIWLAEQSRHISQGALIEYRQRLYLFSKICTELCNISNIADINLDTIIRYKEAIFKYPKHAHRRYIGENLTSILNKNNGDVLALSTVAKHVQCVKTFLIWCDAHEYLDATKSLKILKTVKNVRASNKDVFTEAELTLLFTDKRRNRLKNDMATAMLIALFTGARRGEILQLTTDDVYEKEGMWVIDINQNNGKTVKNKTSIGLIPVAAQLIELGFIKWVKSRRGNLFNEPKDSNGGYSQFSKRHRAYCKRIGITRQSVTFHSYRHGFRTKLVELDIHPNVIDGILRHSGQSIGDRIYTHTQNLKNKKAAVDQVRYEFLKPDNLKLK